MTVNEPLDVAAVRALEPGRSTAAEVVEVLGAPTDVVPLGRRSAYRYEAQATKATALVLLVLNMGTVDRRADRVWVFFDERDVLTHVAATFASHRPRYGMPWRDVHSEKLTRKADEDREGLGQ